MEFVSDEEIDELQVEVNYLNQRLIKLEPEGVQNMEEELEYMEEEMEELHKFLKTLKPTDWQYSAVVAEIYELEDKISEAEDYILEEVE